MSNQLLLQQFTTQLSESISSNQFVKISLGNYHGNVKELKQVYVRRVIIKRADMLSFTYRYKTRDIVKNFNIAEGINVVSHLISNDFRICTFFTIAKEVIIEHNKAGELISREKTVHKAVQPTLGHDKEKKRLIQAEGKSYLKELRITDQDGKVFKYAQDKYRQINQYIEILRPLIKELPSGQIKKVVDMGSGKGYLTFALYDYLSNILKLEVGVTGVEYRQDLVDLCNGIAKTSEFDGLRFVQGTIQEYPVDTIDLLIALHACDTATDDAIYKGIKANARLIVVAPCCHKQIRKEMERSKIKNDVSFLTKYGIFLERQAEMVTDGIRALVLEYFGYKTKVIEFISDVHTPKNVLIIGIRSKTTLQRKEEIIATLIDTKARFGINAHHLEMLFDL
ncbi:MAG: SAM-dependent methyltransferase [Flavobacterium sp.]|nr:MAG: SAM-dependent methyltransferase [Flavobacterium sp.]